MKGNVKEIDNKTTAKWVEKCHPLKIGDSIEIAYGFYKGKIMVIDNTWVSEGWGKWRWMASGKVLRENGKGGKKMYGQWDAWVK